MTDPPSRHGSSWKWWICGLLLFASTINYMDRQTLANAAVRITAQFHLTQEQYGTLELAFGWAFAVGSMSFGILVDRISVRWLYPVVLLLWSSVGFATGLVHNYEGLFACRALLGLFEGGHWPCAIKTTQYLLEARDRSFGNSVLQSGTSIGAIITPLVMRLLLTEQQDSWRYPFQLVGAIGLIWIVLWLFMVRGDDLKGVAAGRKESSTVAAPSTESMWKLIFSRRMLVLYFIVASINTCWQTLRAWLPKFLQEGRGYSENHALYFNSLFYVATDVGCIGAGALTLWLVKRGRSVERSRSVVFGACAVLCAQTLLLPLLPRGWPLLAVLLLVGAAALGLFPIYHALTQDISNVHQGKITGITGVAAWALAPPAQKFFGRLIDRTGSFDLGLAIAGCTPLLAFLALWLFWNTRSTPNLNPTK